MAEQIVELVPGESKQVSFEITPNEAKAYNVSINGLSGVFTAYAKKIEFPNIDILSVNGINFSEVGSNWGRLTEPIVADKLPGAVTIRGRNKNIQFVSDSNYKAIYAYIFYGEFGNPAFEGYGSIPWVRMNGYKVANPPFDFAITPAAAIVAGSWTPRLYSARIQVGGVYFDGAGTHPFCTFYLYDFLQCTGSGSVTV